MSGRGCDGFDEQLDELAVGDLSEPARGDVLAHVAGCDACRRRLDELLAITDRLLELAPEHEPPPGFESRVLDRWTGAVGAPARARRGRFVLAAAAALVLVLGLGVLGGALWSRHDDRTAAAVVVRSGTIVATDGARVGTIDLVRAAQPYVLVTVDRPRPGGAEVTCELELADGTTRVVGAWGYDDVRAGVWAVGVDPASLDAIRMRIVDSEGDVLATAELA